ncbi:MAG: tRNA 4-thiouridine(8) synthase ThiI [Gemmatimonadetes bacterium]|nr:tRNA 4-thiouridine(8) synthase ThiI [Gemmatimonadota bacterium]
MGAAHERVVLIHYHEIGLKGRNRGRFERQLCINITRALKGLPRGAVRRLSGRIILELPPDAGIEAIRERLVDVFGIANFSEAIRVPNAIEDLRAGAWDAVRKEDFHSFKIAARRGDKSFPLTSEEINRDVGAHVQTLSRTRVMLDDPDLTCFIEVAYQGAFIYTGKTPGPGGLPVGANERAVSLLSSGIDSPVASYKTMKRGVRLSFVHFHSQPYTNRSSQRNTEELVRVLTRYQYRSTLYLVPLVEIQRRVMTHAPPGYRVVLYRRAMLRIAEAIAEREGAQALVTGESVGQVASQTLSNMRAIEEATPLPLLRPLSGDNKEEIIDLARRIGTYDISIEPYEDCCTVFVPKHPETRANLKTVREIEPGLDLPPLIERALKETDVMTVKY